MKFRGIILISAILVSACGPLGEMQDTKDTGNGAGYPGGDDISIFVIDSYYNLRPDTECATAPDPGTFCYKWEINLTNPAYPVLKSRFDPSYRGYPKASHLHISPHNPDFVGDGGAILTKPRALPLDERGYPALIPEAWCMGPGADGVVISSHDGAAKMGRLYPSYKGADTEASRSVSGSTLTYRFGDTVMTIDRSRTTPETIWRYYGSMELEDGTSVEVTCSLGSTANI